MWNVSFVTEPGSTFTVFLPNKQINDWRPRNPPKPTPNILRHSRDPPAVWVARLSSVNSGSSAANASSNTAGVPKSYNEMDFECSAQHDKDIPHFQTVPGRLPVTWTPDVQTLAQKPWKSPGKRDSSPKLTYIGSAWIAVFSVSKTLIPTQTLPTWMYEMWRIAFNLFWHFHTALQIIFYLHRIRVAGQSVCCQPGPDTHWDRCSAIQIPPSLYRNIVPRKLRNHCSAFCFQITGP